MSQTFDILKALQWKLAMAKELKERKMETTHFKREISLREVWGTRKYFPVMFFAEGISAYDQGFDVASILYSSLSVEFALLIKLNERIGSDIGKFGKEKLRELKSLKGLIRRTYELKVLDSEHKDLADKIRKLRNCYVHYYNLLYFSTQELKRESQLINKQKEDVEKLKNKISWLEQLLQTMEKISKMVEQQAPDISWAISKDAVSFMEERTKEYYKWLLERGITPVFYVKDIKRIGKEPVILRYDRKRFDAYNMLEWCLQILEHTGFVES